jgi:hypothetical protein
MVASDLGAVLAEQYANDPEARDFLHHVRALRAA